MAIALVISGRGSAADNPSVTLDMTGVNFIAAWVVRYTAGLGYNFGDDSSNTYQGLTEYAYTAGFAGGKWFYCWNPTVDSSMVFTNTVTGTFGSVLVLGFSGVKTSADPYNGDGTGANDQSTSSGANLSYGSVAPAAGDLILSGLSTYVDQPTSWSSVAPSMTIDRQYAGAFGTSFGGAVAHLISPGGTITPTWTPGIAQADTGGGIASFAAATGGGGGNPWYAYAQQFGRPRLPKWMRSAGGILMPEPAFG